MTPKQPLMTDELMRLAERCEQATGNEREMLGLFEEAIATCFPKPGRVWVTDNAGPWTPEYSAYHERSWRFVELLEAKGYLDAAMMLVPEGLQWGTGSLYEKTPWAWCDTDENSRNHDLYYAKAATPVLALCAAALRAKAIEAQRAETTAASATRK